MAVRPSVFDPQAEQACRLRAGDRIHCVPIDAATFAGLQEVRQRPRSSHPWPGLATTFQDLGRHNYQQWGATVGGPMDEVSHRLANALLDNAPDAPLLQITLLGPTLHCHCRCRLALTGADLGASLKGQSWPPREMRTLREGDQMSFGRRRNGALAYSAVGGLPHLCRAVSHPGALYQHGHRRST